MSSDTHNLALLQAGVLSYSGGMTKSAWRSRALQGVGRWLGGSFKSVFGKSRSTGAASGGGSVFTTPSWAKGPGHASRARPRAKNVNDAPPSGAAAGTASGPAAAPPPLPKPGGGFWKGTDKFFHNVPSHTGAWMKRHPRITGTAGTIGGLNYLGNLAQSEVYAQTQGRRDTPFWHLVGDILGFQGSRNVVDQNISNNRRSFANPVNLVRPAFFSRQNNFL